MSDLSEKARSRVDRAGGITFAASSGMRLTRLLAEDTPIAIRSADEPGTCATLTVPATGLELIAVEQALIRFALARNGGNRTHAAAFLGLSRSALLYRMRKYHLDSTSPRRSDREPS